MNTPYQEALGSTLISRGIRERIILVAVTMSDRTDDETQESLDELSQLIDTAGADEVARVTQRRDSPDSTYYIGKGKAEELKELCLALDSDTVVFDNELSPAQQFNLEIVEAGPESNAITMRVHERGAGITQACGTGACASAWAANKWGLVPSSVTEILVHQPGGDATVRINYPQRGHVTLIGSAHFSSRHNLEIIS